MDTEPHIDEPPRTFEIADGLAEQEFLRYLMEKVVDRTK
jgi:hypothetical protein